MQGVGCRACNPTTHTPAAVHPVQVEVLRQERRADHADALLHPPRRPQLAHARVNQREPRPPLLPRPQRRRVGAPLLLVVDMEWVGLQVCHDSNLTPASSDL